MSLADSALSFARKAVEREVADAKKDAKKKLRQTAEVLKDGLQMGGKSTFNSRNSQNVMERVSLPALATAAKPGFKGAGAGGGGRGGGDSGA